MGNDNGADINASKIKEMLIDFALKHGMIPHVVSIERVNAAKLLGVIIRS